MIAWVDRLKFFVVITLKTILKRIPRGILWIDTVISETRITYTSEFTLRRLWHVVTVVTWVLRKEP